MKLSAPLIIVDDERNTLHDTGCSEHPEIPARIQAIRLSLQEFVHKDCFNFIPARRAERKYLRLVHSENYLLRFEEAVLAGNTHFGHPDNQICYESFDVACYAAGAGLVAIDTLEQGKSSNALCLVRPPGHHAERSRPLGFCFLNNSVIAARYWQQKYGVKRVLIFDFDAHHGNGIQSAFEDDAHSFYISIHEHPSFSYPGTGYAEEHGLGEGAGTILNIPLRPGAGDKEVLDILSWEIPQKLQQWQPQAIIIAAGFDAHLRDDMSGLCYSTTLYERIGESIRGWAQEYCQGRTLSLLEGGYELSVLGDSVVAYISGILGCQLSDSDD
jgi:acetoin utilization deacetylase AcuC-like enzyme